VLSSAPVENATLLAPAGQPVVLRRGGKDLPSRAADDLFWLGRYSERCAQTIRLLRAALRRIADPQLTVGAELPAILRALAETAATNAIEPAGEGELEANRLLAAALAAGIGESPSSGLRGVIGALGRAASAVRGRLSADAWLILSRLDRELAALPSPARGRPLEARARLRAILDRLEEIFVRLSAFDGLVMESMTRGEGWRFLDMGRRLERSLHLVGLLREMLVGLPPVEESEEAVAATEEPAATQAPVSAAPAADPPASAAPSPTEPAWLAETSSLEALLEIADSLMTYRRRYSSRLQPHAVLDLLLSDESNPRSLVFQLAMLEEHVRALPRETDAVGPSPEERLAIEATTVVRLADPVQLSLLDDAGRRSALEQLLARLAALLPALSEMISQSYLSHAQLPRQLGRLEPAPGAAPPTASDPETAA
jgi:uncharacterized alpha-E superfamily protein